MLADHAIVLRVEAIGRDAVVLTTPGARFTLCEGDTLTVSDIRETISEV